MLVGREGHAMPLERQWHSAQRRRELVARMDRGAEEPPDEDDYDGSKGHEDDPCWRCRHRGPRCEECQRV